jgi:hypothetical protein
MGAMKPSGRVFKNKDFEPKPDATFFFCWKGVGALLVLSLEEIKRVRGKKKDRFHSRACVPAPSARANLVVSTRREHLAARFGPPREFTPQRAERARIRIGVGLAAAASGGAGILTASPCGVRGGGSWLRSAREEGRRPRAIGYETGRD